MPPLGPDSARSQAARVGAIRIGRVRLGRAWLLAGALTVLALGSYEAVSRAHGFEPDIRDGPRLWAFHRGRASGLGSRALVLIGASRMQVDIDLDELRTGTGMEPVQLAIDGTSGTPVLADLAGDKSFRGTVVFSLAAGLPSSDETRAREYVAFYHEQGVSERLEFPLWAAVQQNLAFRHPALSHNALIRAALGRPLPKPHAGRIRADRSRPIDYTAVDPRPRRHRVERALAAGPRRGRSREEFLEDCAKLEAMARQIRARGGDAVFVRMPTSGDLWTLSELEYPKAEYWDRFASTTEYPAIHFADYPALSGYECPDFSHLDASDAPAFTRALAGILMGKLGHMRPDSPST